MKHFARLHVTTAQGNKVDAIATTPDEVDAAYVFAHGAGAGMEHPFMASVAEGLAQRRIACLRFQFPYMQAGKRRVDAPPVAHATVRAAVAEAAELWPNLQLFAGGKSFGGRMASQAQAVEPLPGVSGLIFLGFPLHPAGKPALDRALHLRSIEIPMLFIHGSRDALAEAAPYAEMARMLGKAATHVEVDEADHTFAVPKRSGRTPSDVLEDILNEFAVWTQAWKIHPQKRPGHGAEH